MRPLNERVPTGQRQPACRLVAFCRSVKADQDNTGTLYFDAAAGHFAESSLQQNIGLEITAGKENIIQRLKHTTRMHIKPAAP